MKLSEIIAAYERGEVIERRGHYTRAYKEWSVYNIAACRVDDLDTFCAAGDLRIQPKLKKIDLSVLAGQQVLCEFSGKPDWLDSGDTLIGYLSTINDRIPYKYYMVVGKNNINFQNCRPAFNYEQVYTGQTFPEGLVVKYGFQSFGNLTWCDACAEPIAFLITGIKEGYTI